MHRQRKRGIDSHREGGTGRQGKGGIDKWREREG